MSSEAGCGSARPSTALGPRDNVILITEKAGRLRVIRNGMLEPTPVAGIPQVLSQGTMAGLMDMALHPQFEQNKWIYISYHKPVGRGVGPDKREGNTASNSILRGTWDGKGLTDIKDIFVAICEDAVAIALACFVVSR